MVDVLSEKIFEIVSEVFPNGARADFISENKIRRAFQEKYRGEEIPADLEIFKLLEKFCVKHNEKFYTVKKSDRQKILRLIEETFSDGNVIIFYENFYNQHRDFFSAMNIFSVDILRQTLQNMNYKYFYDKDFFALNEFVKPQNFIQEKFRRGGEITLPEAEKILPYIPPEIIKKTLNDMKNFFYTRSGGYVPEGAVQFDEDEISAAREKFAAAVKENGYALFNTKDLKNNLAMNPNLSEAVVYVAIYNKFLSADFAKQSVVLTEPGKYLGVTDLIKNFCAAHYEIEVQKVFEYAREIGAPAPVNDSLNAVNKIMTRVSKDYFVKDELIHFDIAGVDKALSSFVRGKIISLQMVDRFSNFPPVENYFWNPYMLESFLRKYSRRYTFGTPATNNAATGAIYPKTMHFNSFLDVQAAVIVQEKLPLVRKVVDDFLIGNGFRKNKIGYVTDKIIVRAQEILDGREIFT